MSRKPGRFNQRVTFQERVSSTNDFGEEVSTWQDIATTPSVWAIVEPLRGREFFQAGQMQSAADVRITILYRADVHERLRVLWKDVPHEIVAPPIDVNAEGTNLELMCTTGVRDGL